MRTAALKARFRVAGMGAPGAAARVEATFRGLPGVLRIRTEPIPPAAAPSWAGMVTVTYLPGSQTPETLERALQGAGFAGLKRL